MGGLRPRWHAACGAAALAACSGALAQADPVDDRWADFLANASFALGAAASWSPSYAGSTTHALQPRPMWAFQYGRLRLSTAGAAAVLGIAQDPRGPGASLELFADERIKAGLALRIDRGRDSSSVEGLEDLPDVPPTLRARAYASYAPTRHWTAAVALSPDLLGRDGGAVAAADLGYRSALTPASEWYAGVGVNFADATYANSYYGISPETAAATGRSAFVAGAGATSARLGIGFTAALSSRWILYGGAGITRLLGDAAASPLTQQRTATSAALGIAYRWGTRYDGASTVLLPAPSRD